jgi:hypothetical protein
MADNVGRKQASLGQTTNSHRRVGRSELAGGKLPMSRAALRVSIVSAVVLTLFVAAPAFAALSASAVLSTSSPSSPFNYTVDVHNSGDTNIGTFWFAWTNLGADFLPSSPTGVSGPAGWTDPITHNFPSDGYGIEYYNLSGSPISPGADGLFHFTSTASPLVLSGNAPVVGNKITTSWVYIGFPESDAGFRVDATVAPEPTSLVLAGTGAAFGLASLWWRRRASACRHRTC